jgi:hypothetical protein
LFQSRASGEHKYDDCAHQVLAHGNGSEDRYPGQKIGPELAGERTFPQVDEERNAAQGDRDDQGSIAAPHRRSKAVPEQKMHGDGNRRQSCNVRLAWGAEKLRYTAPAPELALSVISRMNWAENTGHIHPDFQYRRSKSRTSPSKKLFTCRIVSA